LGDIGRFEICPVNDFYLLEVEFAQVGVAAVNFKGFVIGLRYVGNVGARQFGMGAKDKMQPRFAILLS
jgi:hypothetical protein